MPTVTAPASSTARPLPPAPSAGTILHMEDGTCFWRPPPLKRPGMNPPAPHAVQCPDEPDD
jgi:hypothetical protein